MILLDTSGLLANYDRRDRHHAESAKILAHPQRRILSPFVLADLDYLVAQVAGQYAELVVLEDVARGAYQLEAFSAVDIVAAKTIIERYADLRLGLADASISGISASCVGRAGSHSGSSPRIPANQQDFVSPIPTPHIASGSFAARARMASLTVENLLAALNEARPPNLVNPDVLTRTRGAAR